jgi:hypothetical protein
MRCNIKIDANEVQWEAVDCSGLPEVGKRGELMGTL